MGGFLDNTLFRDIYCNLAQSSDPRCAAGGVFGHGLLPAGLDWLGYLITGAIVAALLATILLTVVVGVIWGERRLLGRFQSRLGPNRWGPWGILTPVADLIKVLTKEDVIPLAADRWVFTASPILMVVPVMALLAVIPLGAGTFVANINVGILYILALSSLTTISIVMAGWGSQNRYAMFGAMRSVALLVSYEIPMVLSLLGVLLLAGSLSLGQVIAAQKIPFIIVQPLGFLVFVITAIAEMNRPPFDLSEAESELGSGYHSDYSGMKFGLFLNAEYTELVLSAALITVLFLSGWRGFFWLPTQIWFLIKLIVVLVVLIWTRATWPRLRVDQTMAFTWKGLVPLTLANLLVSALELQAWPSPSVGELWIMAAINWAVTLAAIYLFSRWLAPAAVTRPVLVSERSVPPRQPAEELAGGS